MNEQIWKFELAPKITIHMPENAQVLSAKDQGANICIWVLVRPLAPIVLRNFEVYRTGHSIDTPESLKFIDTVMLDDGGINEFHVFERVQ